MGGMGSAAFEVLFSEIEEEIRLDHVTIISRSRPNSYDDVVHMRSKRGEDYWNLRGFPLSSFEDLFDKFQQKCIPVNCCQLNSDTNLKHISLSTGGNLLLLGDKC